MKILCRLGFVARLAAGDVQADVEHGDGYEAGTKNGNGAGDGVMARFRLLSMAPQGDGFGAGDEHFTSGLESNGGDGYGGGWDFQAL